jgi:hypothetical protein
VTDVNLIERAREILAQKRAAVEAARAANEVPGPRVRPVVPPPQDPVPELTAAEVVELLELLHPLHWHCSKCNRWRQIDVSLHRLREYRHHYTSDLQDRADAAWQQTGAYRQLVDQATAAAYEAQSDRDEQRRREAKDDAWYGQRVNELVAFGVGVLDAHRQARSEQDARNKRKRKD